MLSNLDLCMLGDRTRSNYYVQLKHLQCSKESMLRLWICPNLSNIHIGFAVNLKQNFEWKFPYLTPLEERAQTLRSDMILSGPTFCPSVTSLGEITETAP